MIKMIITDGEEYPFYSATLTEQNHTWLTYEVTPAEFRKIVRLQHATEDLQKMLAEIRRTRRDGNGSIIP